MSGPAVRFQRKHITDAQVRAACLTAHAPAYEGRENTLDLLVAATGAPRKVALAKLHQCSRRRLINYGTGAHWAWWEGP